MWLSRNEYNERLRIQRLIHSKPIKYWHDKIDYEKQVEARIDELQVHSNVNVTTTLNPIERLDAYLAMKVEEGKACLL